MNLRALSLVLVVGLAPVAACSSSGSSGGGATGGAAGAAGGSTGGTSGSGGGSAGSGGGSASLCEDVCTKIGALGCSGENKADCLTDCNAQYSTCKSEFDALGPCMLTSATLSCDSSGDLTIKGCDAALLPYGTCTACLPEVDDDACATCNKASCCSENKALFATSDVLSLIACNDACAPNDAGCSQACFDANPNAKAAFQAIAQCQATNCSAACI